MKPTLQFFLLLIIGIAVYAPTVRAEDDMTVFEGKKSSTTNFDTAGTTGNTIQFNDQFSVSEEKARRAKAREIARRAQERQDAKIAGHSSKRGHKFKRRVASNGASHRSKNRKRADKALSDSDF